MNISSVNQYKPHIACGDDDSELQKRVMACLQRWTTAKCDVKAEVAQGMVSLRGKVASDHDRWLLLGCCGHVAGVRQVVDDLEIVGVDRSPPIVGNERPASDLTTAIISG